jgi:hypothetical protein
MVEPPTKGKAKNKDKVMGKRSTNFWEEEDVALCHVWTNVSVDASIGANQLKDRLVLVKNWGVLQ